MTPIRSALALLLLAALTSGGCGEPDGTPTAGDPSASRSGPDESAADTQVMAELAALGYVNWDDGADEDLRGVVAQDPEAAAPGYNFYTDHAESVFLIDMEGKPVHRWRLPETERSLFAELLDDGSIIVTLGPDTLAKIGPDSKLVWELPLQAHHDVAVADDGTLYVVTSRWIVYQERRVLFDGIARVSPDGRLLSQWWSFDFLPELTRYHAERELDRPPVPGKKGAKVRRDYYHTNSIELLPDTPLGRRDPRFRAGNLMVCLHQVNLVMILDQDDMSVTWAWGGDELDWPHMPTMLDDGNILVFDNGSHRGWSRVVEVEPVSGEIVWSYEGDPRESFFTKFRGCNQRLENGNTLICESERGRVFEVTMDGRIVWEYWNPMITDGKRRRISRLNRYPAEYVAPLLGDAPDSGS